MLRKYESDPSHILRWTNVVIDEDVTDEEGLVQILDSREQVLQTKTIPLVKVLWRHHGVEEDTWELKQEKEVVELNLKKGGEILHLDNVINIEKVSSSHIRLVSEAKTGHEASSAEIKLVVGDWNATKFHSDKQGGRWVPQKLLDEFNEYLHNTGLMELFASNGDWSWCNKQGRKRRIMAKLDRVFTNDAWLQLFTGTKISYSASFSSDHYGVVINIFRQFTSGPKPFKMLKIWCLQDGIMEVIKKAWDVPIPATPIHILLKKLRKVKAAVKLWNKESFGDIEERVLTTKKSLEEIQLTLLDNPTNDMFDKENQAQDDYSDALSAQEILYVQKSWIVWLKDIDRCTGYFHSKMKQHHQFNAITSVDYENG
ncbi:uncharacterized protein LOC132296560 [Cornus florida]|uniref:uncharacterized protein LOC132296560 n=1 Tax=Cornus florida TaxID=4283 RepID=UPI00289A92AB|nr:uncharacterized protein LOC132296560 [Cornus florida]